MAITACTGAASGTAPPPVTSAPVTPLPSATPTVVPPVPEPSAMTTARPQRRLRYALDREPASLDPFQVRDEAGRTVVDAVHDSLTRMSPNLVVVQPAAAESWESSDDLRTWTFTLRPDAVWHDGTPVVAGDFVRAYRRLALREEPAPFNRWVLDPLRDDDGGIDVRARDDRTLEIHLPRPDGDLPTLVSDPALAPRHPDGFDPEQPVGNGPFRMVEPWAHNQFVRLAPATDHWEPVTLDEVVLPIYAQRGADEIQYADFRAGSLDVAAVPVEEVTPAVAMFGSGSGGYRGPGVLTGERATVAYLGFDLSSAPWDDPDLRRALSLLVDRDVLVAQTGREARSAASGIVPGGLPGGGLARCDHCDRDLVASLDLLATVVSPPTEPVRLLAPDDAANQRVAEAVAGSLEDGLEVPVLVDTLPLADYARALADGDFDLFLATFTATQASMGGLVEPLLWSGSPPLDNPGRIASPEVDAAIDRARDTASQTVRLSAWQDAEQAALDQVLVAPLYHPLLRTVVAEDVTGLRVSPDGRVDLATVDVVADS